MTHLSQVFYVFLWDIFIQIFSRTWKTHSSSPGNMNMFGWKTWIILWSNDWGDFVKQGLIFYPLTVKSYTCGLRRCLSGFSLDAQWHSDSVKSGDVKPLGDVNEAEKLSLHQAGLPCRLDSSSGESENQKWRTGVLMLFEGYMASLLLCHLYVEKWGVERVEKSEWKCRT